jgi:hypothetical protein
MASAFLQDIYDCKPGRTPHKELLPDYIFQACISYVVGDFSLDFLAYTYYPQTLKRLESYQRYVKAAGGGIAFLLCNCTTLGLHNELDDFVVQISSEAARSCEAHHNPAHLFDDIYMPLLKIILAMLQEKRIKVEGSPFQQLFRRILSLYIVEFVGKEPAAQLNWARTPMDCDCPHCHSQRIFAQPNGDISTI